ncbi:MAG: mannonate dehydratase [Anaerolineae bacterium]
MYQPDRYQRLLDIQPSHYNGLEFCLGTLAEMTEGDIYEVVSHYSRQGAVLTFIFVMCGAKFQIVKYLSMKVMWICCGCCVSSRGIIMQACSYPINATDDL